MTEHSNVRYEVFELNGVQKKTWHSSADRDAALKKFLAKTGRCDSEGNAV